MTFVIFFLLTYVASWSLMHRHRLWKWFIIGASYVFYGWWDWRLVFLLAGASLLNQAFAVQIWRARRRSSAKRAGRTLLIVAVAANLGVLGFFKYTTFFASSLNELLTVFHLGAPLPLLRVILPVGISFLVFRMLTYVIDVYRDQLKPAAALDFWVYTAFFPCLLAGPISRAHEFLPQLSSPRDPHNIELGRALVLILGGLAKKLLIADYLSTHIVNGLFASPQAYSSWETLVGICAYSVQIYCDFSAYSDIAIGISLLLGFRLPDNFNAPYTARTLQDFWRRWHITLSRWLLDYLYIPLGGNRRGPRRTYINLFLTFLLGGLWHGAGWTFIAWGALHGGGLALERSHFSRRGIRPADQGGGLLARIGQRVGVFAFVSLAWVFFRADSIGSAFAVLWRLPAGLGSIGEAVTLPIILLIVVGIALQYVPRSFIERLQNWLGGIGWVGQAAVFAIGLFLLQALGPEGTAEFLYFKF